MLWRHSRFASATILLVAAVGFYSCLDQRSVIAHLVFISYYIIYGLVSLWGYYHIRFLSASNFPARKLEVADLFFLFPWFIAVLIAITVHPYLNTSTGEMHALAVSQNMMFHKTIEAGYFGSATDNFFAIPSFIDVRPFLFPFLLSLVNTIVGYNEHNLFVLNFILMGIVLSILYFCARRIEGHAMGCAATLFLASCPLFSLCARGGSSDLCATLFIGLVFINLYFFMKDRTSPQFALLWLNLLMLAHVREESPLYFVIIIGTLFLFRYITKKHLSDAWVIIAATPLLVLPIFWQRLVHNKTNFGVSSTDALFSLNYLKINLGHFIRSLVDFHFLLPYPTLLHLAFWFIFAALIVDVFFVRKDLWKCWQKHFILIAAFAMGLHFLLMLSYWYENVYENASVMRYFLPFSVLFSISPLFLLSIRFARFPQRTHCLLGLSICSFLLYHPVAIQNYLVLKDPSNLETTPEYKFLKSRKTDGLLIIGIFPWRFTGLGWKAVDFDFANREIENVSNNLDRYAINEIDVFRG